MCHSLIHRSPSCNVNMCGFFPLSQLPGWDAWLCIRFHHHRKIIIYISTVQSFDFRCFDVFLYLLFILSADADFGLTFACEYYEFFLYSLQKGWNKLKIRENHFEQEQYEVRMIRTASSNPHRNRIERNATILLSAR